MTPGKGIQVNDNRKKNDPGSFTSGLDDLVVCDVVIGGGRGGGMTESGSYTSVSGKSSGTFC